MKELEIEIIKKEIIGNWKTRNEFLGIKRFRLISFSQAKNWKIRKVLALMRKNKEIFLYKTYYFISEEAKKLGLKEEC